MRRCTEKKLAETYLGKSQHPGQSHGLKPPRRRISGASEVSTTEGQRNASPRPLAYQKMRTGKCWFEKGDFDHFRMCFGCFRAHFGPGGSLKQPQHVKMMQSKKMRTGLLVWQGWFWPFGWCWFESSRNTTVSNAREATGQWWEIHYITAPHRSHFPSNPFRCWHSP